MKRVRKLLWALSSVVIAAALALLWFDGAWLVSNAIIIRVEEESVASGTFAIGSSNGAELAFVLDDDIQFAPKRCAEVFIVLSRAVFSDPTRHVVSVLTTPTAPQENRQSVFVSADPRWLARATFALQTTVWSYRDMALFTALFREVLASSSSNRSRGWVADCGAQVWQQAAASMANSVFHRLSSIGGLRRNNGVLYVASGARSLAASFVKGSSFRKGWYPQRRVLHAAQAIVTNFTLIFLTFHDEDIYFQTRWNVQERLRLKQLLDEFPNFFLMHYSPSLVGGGASVLGPLDPFHDPQAPSGALFPRIIPVAHPLQQTRELMLLMLSLQANQSSTLASWSSLLPPYERRTQRVVWRGATTGKYPKPYRNTDRFRMVAAFAGAATASGSSKKATDSSWADVAFSGLCQKVKLHILPAYRHGTLSLASLVRYQVHIDVDGNTNSWEGLRWRLLTGMAVVKVHSSLGFTQWYYRHLRNMTHLLVVKSPEDVVEAARFLLQRPDVASRLSQNAAIFGAQFLTLDAVNEAVDAAVKNAWSIAYSSHRDVWTIQPHE